MKMPFNRPGYIVSRKTVIWIAQSCAALAHRLLGDYNGDADPMLTGDLINILRVTAAVLVDQENQINDLESDNIGDFSVSEAALSLNPLIGLADIAKIHDEFSK